MRTDGRRFCIKTLARISRRTRAKKRTFVVFDIDNTLVDTRHRTLGAARTFLKSRPGGGSGNLRNLGMHLVRFDGRQTAVRLGLKGASARAFTSHWERFFWNPGNLKLDTPIKDTVKLAQKAKKAGADVYYITGRISAHKEGTVKQLKRLGLPDVDDAHVICKPNPRSQGPGKRPLFVPTAPFKLSQVRRLLGKGSNGQMGWFMSDSKDDVAALQRGLGCRNCVWVDFPVQPARKPPEVRGGTPTISLRR